MQRSFDKGWTPVYRAITWIDRPDGAVAFVTLDRDEDDIMRLRGREVIIDGEKYRCVNVRTYGAGLCRRGESIGIVVQSRAVQVLR